MSITQFSPDTLRSNITDFAKGGRYNVEIITEKTDISDFEITKH